MEEFQHFKLAYKNHSEVRKLCTDAGIPESAVQEDKIPSRDML